MVNKTIKFDIDKNTVLNIKTQSINFTVAKQFLLDINKITIYSLRGPHSFNKINNCHLALVKINL